VSPSGMISPINRVSNPFCSGGIANKLELAARSIGLGFKPCSGRRGGKDLGAGIGDGEVYLLF
jgi:hypothetical protein